MKTVDYFERKLDDKRRLTIPAELHSEFGGEELVITRGFGKYLHLYTKTVWNQLVEPKLQGDILDEQVADLNVKFRIGKVEAKIDGKQGRISLDQQLLTYAGIGRDVAVVRVGAYWRIMAKTDVL